MTNGDVQRQNQRPTRVQFRRWLGRRLIRCRLSCSLSKPPALPREGTHVLKHVLVCTTCQKRRSSPHKAKKLKNHTTSCSVQSNKPSRHDVPYHRNTFTAAPRTHTEHTERAHHTAKNRPHSCTRAAYIHTCMTSTTHASHQHTLGLSADTRRLSVFLADATDATDGVTARGMALAFPTLADALVPMLPMLV